jgi:hypothetical protein
VGGVKWVLKCRKQRRSRTAAVEGVGDAAGAAEYDGVGDPGWHRLEQALCDTALLSDGVYGPGPCFGFRIHSTYVF